MFGIIFEMIWPRLQGEVPVYSNFLDEEHEIFDERSDESINFALFMYEKQKERISSIESKSSIYIGFFSAVVAIVAFALKDVIFQRKDDIFYDVAMVFLGILIIYILQVIRFSIKAMERKSYHSFDESDFLCVDRNKIAVKLINKTKKNYDVVNQKVDDMTMAHEFTKRIIWLVFIAAVFLVAFPIFKYYMAVVC